MSKKNPDCDGSDESCKGSLEVRILPTGDSNLILCRDCHAHEMAFRRERARSGIPFEIPAFESLKVYERGA